MKFAFSHFPQEVIVLIQEFYCHEMSLNFIFAYNMLATQRNCCLIERKTGHFIAIFGIWNRKRTESVRRFNRRFAHALKLATEPSRGSVRFGSNRLSVRFPFFASNQCVFASSNISWQNFV